LVSTLLGSAREGTRVKVVRMTTDVAPLRADIAMTKMIKGIGLHTAVIKAVAITVDEETIAMIAMTPAGRCLTKTHTIGKKDIEIGIGIGDTEATKVVKVIVAAGHDPAPMTDPTAIGTETKEVQKGMKVGEVTEIEETTARKMTRKRLAEEGPLRDQSPARPEKVREATVQVGRAVACDEH